MTFAHTRMVRGGDHLYVGSDALKVVDISSPGAPTVVGSLANYCQGPALDGATLFGAAADLLVTDVSNPANPALLGAVWSTRQLLEGVGVALTPPGPVGGRRYAFAAYDTALGLGHVEIDDVTPPLVYGEESLLRYQGDVAGSFQSRLEEVVFSGDYLYTVTTLDGLHISHIGPFAYSWSLDKDPSGAPDAVADGTESGLSGATTVTAPSDGVWYFHVRARHGDGDVGSRRDPQGADRHAAPRYHSSDDELRLPGRPHQVAQPRPRCDLLQ